MSKHATKTRQGLKGTPLNFSIDLSKLTFDENGNAPAEIQVLMCGKWNHPVYGPIIITPVEITEFKQNFDAGLRRDIPVTEGHESWDEKPAVGWFAELIDKGQEGLWAKMDWTPQGKTLLAEKSYKYFSPEFYTEYEDPETREIYKNVLVGGALTNKPYFKQMKAVVLSEQGIINNNFNFSDMDLQTILTKKVEELTAEEKTFLAEHKDELTTEQLATYGSVLEAEAETETPAEAETPAEGEGADETPAEETPEGEAPAVEASEKNVVQISASEYKALTKMANNGAKAFAELRKNKIETEAKELIFSEQNSKGKVLPKDEQKVFSFMLGLTDAQRSTFAEIVKAIPNNASLFNEVGSGSPAAEGTAVAELDGKVKVAMSEDKNLTYADAVRKVIASDRELAKRYNSEVSA